jgi:hypothetical protein
MATFITDTALPESISTLFTQLGDKISELDTSVGKILQEHENDFLVAYKIHMIDIQKEIKLLKQTITFEEIKRKRDEEILAREKERDWFRNEALRLDKICKDFMRSSEVWKSKAKMLESDKKLLEEKIRTLNSNFESKKLTKTLSPSKKIECNKPHIDESAATLKTSTSNTYINYENTISHLKSEVKFLKDCIKKLKSEKSSIFYNKYALQNLFLDCVEIVKQDAIQARSAPKSDESFFQGFEDFNDIEKRKMMYMLMAKPEVSEIVKNYLFRTRKSVTPKRLVPSASSHGLSSHIFSTPKKYRVPYRISSNIIM